jgi:hypothetical protein
MPAGTYDLPPARVIVFISLATSTVAYLGDKVVSLVDILSHW